MSVDEELINELAQEAAEVSPEEAPKPTLERMQELAAEVLDIDMRIEKNTARIKELMDRRTQIVSSELVGMMDDTHITKLQVEDKIFTAGAYYKAAIPAENPEPGLNWLEENGAGDLVKNQVIVEFSREHAEEAKLAVDLIKKRFQMATVERKRSVHWATLTSWLKETHQRGDMEKKMPPLEIIGGIIGRIVRITKAKGE